jgi:hypothetical protein
LRLQHFSSPRSQPQHNIQADCGSPETFFG